VTLSPIRDAAGTVVGAATVARDMSEYNRIESDRRTLTERLHQSERLESLGQLAAGIAHDFNNLLAIIVNFADFVADETTDRPTVHADVEEIRGAAERARRLTSRLLVFARRTPVEAVSVDLDAIVADIHDMLSRTIGNNVELVVGSERNLPSIRADRGQIERVLVNLAVNARDAMPDGGTLTIATAAIELDDSRDELRPAIRPGPHVELTVSDTGTGMTAEVAANIFQPFFSTKPEGEGTGLGLATVWGILVESGGSVAVYSEEGTGTTFKLYFPATNSPVAPVADTVSIGPRGNGETILVVDDEAAVLELTSRILRSNGYHTLPAATFTEALSLAAAHDFQLLLTDSVMPQTSGGALAAQINDLRPGRPVLYMSGHNPDTHHPQHTPGDPAFIQKPFDRHTLLEHVHTALTPPWALTSSANQ